jgi:predicted PurR-regulated permease PerM
MMLAYDYPILGLFWTMLILFIWIAWIMLLFHVLVDIFRSHDMGGIAKALWAIFVVIVPFLGVLVYLIARGRSMTERDIKHAQDREAEFRSYVQNAAGSSTGSAEELAKLAELKAQGVLTEAEFAQQKAKILG